MPDFHLAQLNVARMRAPLDSPVMEEFVARLAGVNALADVAPGFVWRLQTEEGDATAVRAFDDERVLVNLSVWRDLGALRDFVYRSAHTEVMRRRREWFERMEDAYVVLWWVPAGTVPGVEEARARLEDLRRYGPSPLAFTFRPAYPPPGASEESVHRSFTDECPAL